MSIPKVIVDAHWHKQYERGAFLGRGSFGTCYVFTEQSSKVAYAGKCINKSTLTGHRLEASVKSEIEVHRRLIHPNIVKYSNDFIHKSNIYIIMELCERNSVALLLTRRSVISKTETIFYMKGMLSGLEYMHENRIMHRDLKLSNILLSSKMHPKLADFGLAEKVNRGELKMLYCGTIMYMAPEIIARTGYDMTADIWAMGCIFYQLITGKCPFNGTKKEDVIKKIRSGNVNQHPSINKLQWDMLSKMLHREPSCRLSAKCLLLHPFLQGFAPEALPRSSLMVAPKFPLHANDERKPFQDMKNVDHGNVISWIPSKFNSIESMKKLKAMLEEVIKRAPIHKEFVLTPSTTDPAVAPIVWVRRWIDVSATWGFCYEYSDGTTGVLFNDKSTLTLFSNNIDLQYIEENGKESYARLGSEPTFLVPKTKKLLQGLKYINECLTKNVMSTPTDKMCRMPTMHRWLLSKNGNILMQLTNHSLQINFNDHIKYLFCPLTASVSIQDSKKCVYPFKFQTVIAKGCSKDIYNHLELAYKMLTFMIKSNVERKK